MRHKRRRAVTSSTPRVFIESLEKRLFLSATAAQTTLAVPTAQAPVAPWIVSKGSADPGDEMLESAAISSGGASAGDIAVLAPVQNFVLGAYYSVTTTPLRLYLSSDHGSTWHEVDVNGPNSTRTDAFVPFDSFSDSYFDTNDNQYHRMWRTDFARMSFDPSGNLYVGFLGVALDRIPADTVEKLAVGQAVTAYSNQQVLSPSNVADFGTGEILPGFAFGPGPGGETTIYAGAGNYSYAWQRNPSNDAISQPNATGSLWQRAPSGLVGDTDEPMAVGDDGKLYIFGTDGISSVAASLGSPTTFNRPANNDQLTLIDGGAAAVQINGLAGDDTIVFLLGSPAPLSGGTINIDGGAGANALKFVGTSANDVLTVNSASVQFSNGSAALVAAISSIQKIQFNGGSGGNDLLDIHSGAFNVDADTATVTPTVRVAVDSGANATFTTDQHLAALTLNGGHAKMTTTGWKTLYITALSITNGGLLDIDNNLLYVDNTATPFATLQAYWRSGYNNDPSQGFGLWDGTTGITSSVAKASAQIDATITLGYLDGAWQNDPNIGPFYDFGGPGMSTNTILVRLVWMGDVNLSNQANGDDMGLIIGLGYYGTGTAPHGWLDGDLNGDGRVDGNDIGLIIGTGNGNYGPP